MANRSSSVGITAERCVSVPGRSQRGWGWLGEISDALVSIVFPSGCRICEKLLTTASRVPLCEECLSRPDKQVLSLEERWESVRGAFATRPGSQVDNLRVLLVDDVLTTGATLDACARALREAGVKSVVGLTVARAVRNPLPGAREW